MRMNERIKRALSVLLCLYMVVQYVPTDVIAIDTDACTCGSEDEFHETTCPEYVAPENPECYCVEKCTDETLNTWCDVCGVYGAQACEGGEDTAATYACTTHTYSNGICSACSANQAATDSDGDGYYDIDNAGKLLWFAAKVNAGSTSYKAELLNNITLPSGKVWTPIGSSSYAFAGIFEGGNYTVYLGSQTISADYRGLIGHMNNATVRNVTVYGTFTISATRKYVAGVVGYSKGTSYITNCHSYVDITRASAASSSHYFAGIVGYAGGTTYVNRCANHGTLVSNSTGEYFAGVVGYITAGKITNCANYGDISGATLLYYVAGILGYVNNTGFQGIQNCLNIGTITGSSHPSDKGNSSPADIACVVLDGVSGSVKNNYYTGTRGFGINNLNGTGTKVTTAQLNSGEITYKLNGDQSSIAWYQTLGIQDYPSLQGKKVLYDSTLKVYYNEGCCKIHSYDSNGFCKNILEEEQTTCGEYQPATDSNSDGYYEIDNAGKLFWLAQQVNNGKNTLKAKLLNDIIVPSGKVWTPIGNDANRYAAIFDGGNYIVDLGDQIVTTNEYALIGSMYGATVKNVTVKGDYSINAVCSKVAGVVGYTRSTSYITNCHSYVNITLNVSNASVYQIAGIVANSVDSPTISHCANYGNIVANGAREGVAGITTYTTNAKIINCANYGNITSTTASYVAGILAYENSLTFQGIQNCLNVGTITANSYAASANTNFSGYTNSLASYPSDIACVMNRGAADTVTNNYYNGTRGFGVNNISGVATQVTEAQLKSGEVTYKLNNSQSPVVWTQTIGVDEYPNFDSEQVYYHSNIYYNDIVYVEISWTPMEFSYTPGDWQPETHTTDTGVWETEDGNGKITVKSVGGKDVNVTLSFDSEMSGVRGRFDTPSGGLSMHESMTANLTLTGKPAELAFTNKLIGNIVVSVAEATS